MSSFGAYETQVVAMSEHLRITGDPVRDTLSQLQSEVAEPFNEPYVLDRIYKLAEIMNPHLAEYDLVVGEDTSGRMPAILFWRLVNARRAEHGLAPAALRFINGTYEGETPAGLYPVESTDDARAVIVSEYVCTGGSVKNAYRSVIQQRKAEQVDIAALDAESQGRSKAAESVEIGSQFYAPMKEDGEINMARYLYGSVVRHHKGVVKFMRAPHSERLSGWHRNQEVTNRARQDLTTIAKAIYNILPPATRSN